MAEGKERRRLALALKAAKHCIGQVQANCSGCNASIMCDDCWRAHQQENDAGGGWLAYGSPCLSVVANLEEVKEESLAEFAEGSITFGTGT